jgi:hypothetical protein
LSSRISRNQTSFFSIYIQPHLNEALNPSQYPLPMRKIIQINVKKRCKAWQARYPKRGAAYFEAVTRSLFNWYGEDYGHSKNFDALVRIGDICFE